MDLNTGMPGTAEPSCFWGDPGVSSHWGQGGGPDGGSPPPEAAPPSPGLPLVEEEDIDGAHRGHDPDQPPHVRGPGAQLAKVQPGGESRGHSLRRFSLGGRAKGTA